MAELARSVHAAAAQVLFIPRSGAAACVASECALRQGTCLAEAAAVRQAACGSGSGWWRQPECRNEGNPAAMAPTLQALGVAALACAAGAFVVPPASRTAHAPTQLASMAPGRAGKLVRTGSQELTVPMPPAPKLITFDAEGTLLQLASPKGLILRESLLKAHNYMVRLPGPDLFQATYDKALAAAVAAQPCYGCGTGVSSHAWWYGVTRESLVETVEAHGIPASEMVDPVMEELFDELYHETFTGPEAYELRPDVLRTLDALAEWRAAGTGPLLAVVANADERLPTVLHNLGVLPVFDFVLTSRQIGSELPARAMFDVALDKAGLTNAAEALHCGDDFEMDILGADAAGWRACLVTNPPAPEGPQAYTVMGISGLLPKLGLPALGGPVQTTRRRGQFVESE